MQIKLDKTVYEKIVVLKTAFSFTEKVYLHIEQDEQYWYVSWIPKDAIEIDCHSFENELIEQAIRYDLLRETQDLRKLILARAFASTMLEMPDTYEESEFKSENKNSNLSAEEILQGWFDGRDKI